MNFDTVVSMLPGGISAELEDGEKNVQLNFKGWDCPEYETDDDGNWPFAGAYTFTAMLPEEYLCVPEPSVIVVMGGTALYEDVVTHDDYTFDRGSVVILTATADSGYHFREWQPISGGAVITNSQFTMPAGDVKVKAVFEKDSSSSSGSGV